MSNKNNTWERGKKPTSNERTNNKREVIITAQVNETSINLGKNHHQQQQQQQRNHQHRVQGNNNYQKKSFNNNKINKTSFYDDYLDIELVYKRLELGTLFCGNLRVYPNRRRVGYIQCNSMTIDVCIDDEKFRNRAIHGDKVCIEILPESDWIQIINNNNNNKEEFSDINKIDLIDTTIQQDELNTIKTLWQPKYDLLREFEGDSLKDDAIYISNGYVSTKESIEAGFKIETLSKKLNLQPKAKIVYILERNHKKTQVGSLTCQNPLRPNQKLPQEVSYVNFQPNDQRYPNLIIPRMALPMAYIDNPYQQQNQIYLADTNSEQWSKDSKMAQGENVRSIGENDSIQAQTEALLMQNDIRHGIFTSEMLEPLHNILGNNLSLDSIDTELNSTWQIPEKEVANRKDLRSYRIFTIDPPNAKDLDDALHITLLDDGTFEIGVHIADVSYFLEENTDLDMEARERATSTYLVQKVIPMLPSILCEQLCSLNPNVDRLAFSCIWNMNSDGSLTDKEVWYGKTIIRSCAKLDYPTAQRMIDGLIPNKPSSNNDNPDSFLSSLSEDIWEKNRHPIGHSAWECSQDVCRMHMVAMNRRKERLSNGALTLNKPKLSFRLDENGNPYHLSSYIIRESNQLVEEYMLLANYLVAQELIVKVGKAAFLRNHPLPKMKGLDELKDLCSQLGLDIDITSAKTLQLSLQKIISTVSPEVSQSITALLTHPMNLAQYIVADSCSSKGWAHYALAIPYYTHFTSPIRRYADVMVHRLLFLGLKDENAMENSCKIEKIKEFSRIADNCNERKKLAKEAQIQSDKIFLCVYLIKNPMEVNAIVIGIGEKSFSILIPDFGIEQRIFIDDMIGVTSVYEEEKKNLILTRIFGGNSRDSKDAFGRDRAMLNNNDNGKCISNKMKFERLDIHLMQSLVVYLSSKEKPPIDICMTIVRSGKITTNNNSNDARPPLPSLSISSNKKIVNNNSNKEKNDEAARIFLEQMGGLSL